MALRAAQLSLRNGKLPRNSLYVLGASSQTIHTTSTSNFRTTQIKASGKTHWVAERALSVGLLGLLPAAVAFPGQAVDMAIAIALPVHNHMGMDIVITDYIHGAVAPKLCVALNWIVGGATMAGLVYFNINDVGITAGIGQLWAVTGK
eukprot:m.334550 g.334550  ORF g.334550 m.334550 type:complete len:148 (+) comp17381_c0_seq1:45-488(+)